MEIKVIHISQVLKLMNAALMNRQKVGFKAWKLGTGPNDPERGELKTYDGVYVTSHSKTGSYRVFDPLAEDKEFRYRRVNEAFIAEFMGKKVIW